MSWFKVCDSFHSHPKVKAIPIRRRAHRVGVWTLVGNWCAQHETDGVAPIDVTREYGASTSDVECLVSVGLWEKIEGGRIRFHDWADYQPTSDKLAKQREKTAKKVADWRAKKASCNPVTPPVSNQVGNPVSNPAPVPSRPEPIKEPPKPPTGGESFKSEIQEVFEHWVKTFPGGSGPPLKLTKTRATKVRRRLEEGFSVADLKRAISGAKGGWHEDNGHTDLATLLKSESSTRKHLANAPTTRAARQQSPFTAETEAVFREHERERAARRRGAAAAAERERRASLSPDERAAEDARAERTRRWIDGGKPNEPKAADNSQAEENLRRLNAIAGGIGRC